MVTPAEPCARHPAVLLAEHESEVAELARRYLARAGLRVTRAATPQETIAALCEDPAAPAVAVLDLTMPGLDGRRLRRLLAPRETPTATAPTPAIYLLGSSMRPRDVRASADCCLHRPFSPRLLVARVLSALPSPAPPAPPTPELPVSTASPASAMSRSCRSPISGLEGWRAGGLEGGGLEGGGLEGDLGEDSSTPGLWVPPAVSSAPTTPEPPSMPGLPATPSATRAPEPPPNRGLALDSVTRRVRIGGRDITLTPAEFALLSALAAHAGRVLTRDQLQAAMRRPSSGRAVDVHVAQLRAKLPVTGPIRTVRGVGYILDEPRAAPGRSRDG